MTNKEVPQRTIMRLSAYGGALSELLKRGVLTVSSNTLGEMVGSSAAQVRKDLSCFGDFGEPGIGYHVELLKDTISRILGTDRIWNVAVIGVGRLGSALLAYPGFPARGFRIIAAFDTDITKVGKKWEDIVIRDISQLSDAVKELNLQVAILCVPEGVSQQVVEKVVSCGIKALFNFAPGRVSVPDGVRIRKVDLSGELECLSYYLTHE